MPKLLVRASEVVELLKRVGNGEVAVELEDMEDMTCKANPNRPFHNVYKYKVDGWIIEVYRDCGEFDYIERVVSPDGRVGCYVEWGQVIEEEVSIEEKAVDEGEEWQEPSVILYFEDNECYKRMEKAFNSVERREEG